MIKVNEYFNGLVKSLEVEIDGERFSTGIFLPGHYPISTNVEEHVTVTVGSMEVQVPGEGWKTMQKGESTVLPRKTDVRFRVQKPVSYVCCYK